MTPHKKIVKMMGKPNCEFAKRIARDTLGRVRKRRVVSCIPMTGWLVGVRVVPSQWKVVYVPSSFSDDYECFGYYEDRAPRMTIALVALWPTKPPIEVPAESIFPVGTFPGAVGPDNPRECDAERMRQDVREHPEWYRRDAKGRFVKGGA